MSQEQFALCLGVSPRTYQDWEQGRANKLPVDALVKIQEIGIDLTWLLTGQGAPPPPIMPAPLNIEADAKQEPASMGRGEHDADGDLVNRLLEQLEHAEREGAARLALLRASYAERQRLDTEVHRLQTELGFARSTGMDKRARDLAAEAWRRLGLDGPFDLARLLEVVVTGLSLTQAQETKPTIHAPGAGARPGATEE
jgi:transcriptional regulator with XRE-family HTH domain